MENNYQFIMQKIAYEFASTNGKFIEGEPAIAKSPYYSYEYARNILKGSFPLGEPAIAKDEYRSFRYVHEVLKEDFYINDDLICKYDPSNYDPLNYVN
jgi:hypothetical protein